MAISERADIDISKTLKSQQIVPMTAYFKLVFHFFNFLHVLLLQVQEPI